MLPMTIVHLLSGGLDSTVMLHDLNRQGNQIHCILFDYAQRHIKELTYAKRHCDRLNIPFTIIELHRIKGLFSHCLLTDGDGDEVVPNRNAVFLHIAAAIAVSNKAQSVTFAANKDDQWRFPDCTVAFVRTMNETLKEAKLDVEICTPYIGMTKWQIVQYAKKMAIDWRDTWSCYSDGNEPCGKCEACRQRSLATKT